MGRRSGAGQDMGQVRSLDIPWLVPLQAGRGLSKLQLCELDPHMHPCVGSQHGPKQAVLQMHSVKCWRCEDKGRCASPVLEHQTSPIPSYKECFIGSHEHVVSKLSCNNAAGLTAN